jgi:predicted transport protein
LPFETLHDERKLAWDVTGRGHRGNGNVEVALDEASDFPYVMGLVRRAYEFQITGD